MKNVLGSALMVLALTAMASTASAHRFNKEQEVHPLRYVGYIGNAVGVVAEFAVARPIHWLVSLPYVDVAVGNEAHVTDDGHYFEYLHGDYSPSVAKERSGE